MQNTADMDEEIEDITGKSLYYEENGANANLQSSCRLCDIGVASDVSPCRLAHCSLQLRRVFRSVRFSHRNKKPYSRTFFFTL